MSQFNPEAKVGLFVIIGIIVLGFMAVKVEKSGFVKNPGYNVQVYFLIFRLRQKFLII